MSEELKSQPDANPEHTLFNEIHISTPVNEDGEPACYLINEQQLQRIRLLECRQPSTDVVLPERGNENEGNSYSVMQAMAYNQALDEVARLNPCRAQAVPVELLVELLERLMADIESHNYGFDGLQELRALLAQSEQTNPK